MPDRKRVPGPTTQTRRGSAIGTCDRRDIAEQVAGGSADDQPALGLVDLYLTFLHDHADRVRQVPDPTGDVGGRGTPGTAGSRLVLHPHLVGTNADAVLVPLHVVDVQTFRMIDLLAQLLVVAQGSPRGL